MPDLAHAVIGYCHPGTVRAEFCSSLFRLGTRARTRIDSVISVTSGPNIAMARNQIVSKFLSTAAEWLLMVDADMVFAHDALDRLAGAADPAERPIVGGLCWQLTIGRGPQPVLFQFRDLPGGGVDLDHVEEYPEDGLFRVAATGTAFLLMHRGALEKVAADAPLAGAPWFCETVTAVPLEILGEDTTFFMRCGMLDIPVYVHTGIKIGHMKTVMLGDCGGSRPVSR